MFSHSLQAMFLALSIFLTIVSSEDLGLILLV